MMDARDEDEGVAPADQEDPGTAALHYLTGPSRGLTAWMGGTEHILSLTTLGSPRLSRGSAPASAARPLARIRRSGTAYSLQAINGTPLWVNGRPATSIDLRHADMIEFGQDGPIARFERADSAHQFPRTIGAIVEDAAGYLRASRRPVAERLPRAISGVVGDVLHRTTLFFRVSVLIALVVIAALALRQSRELDRLESDVAASDTRLRMIAEALHQTQEQALRPGDLAELRAELESRRASTESRVAALEERWQVWAQVIADATPSVGFIEGAFTFRDPETEAFLRHVVNATGNIVMTPFGRPLLSLEGNGPVAERAFTGTGVLIDGAEDAGLLTNRHVALPWENDAGASIAMSQGLEPVMRLLNVYFPGENKGYVLELVRAAEGADLALLGTADGFGDRPRLPLSSTPVNLGDDVVVMGYPTGLTAILARAGPDFIKSLEDPSALSATEIAATLAAAGFVTPLASRGIVSQTTRSTLVFDADTTQGGSGGPVLGMDGGVLALTARIISNFGGSNIGVPADLIGDFLAARDGASEVNGGLFDAEPPLLPIPHERPDARP